MGDLIYRWLLFLLPAELRARSGADMLAAFRAGDHAARTKGPAARWGFLLRELGGLVATAYRARFPDAWTRSTDYTTRNERRREGTMDGIMNDLRFGVRALLRRPGFTALTVLTLSLGIGASTAMFSVVQSVLLKPLPYPDPDRLVSVYPGWPTMREHPTLGFLAERGTWSWPEFFGVVESQTVFDQIAAYERRSMTLTGEGPAEQVGAVRASWQLFPMLGAAPYVGRLFNSDDLTESRVALITHGAWRDRYGADPGAVGRSVTLNQESYEIVGVLQPGFEVASTGSPVFWIPMTGSVNGPGMQNHGGTRAIARLSEGVTVERARDELTTIFDGMLEPGHGEHVGSVFPRHEDETRTARPVILVMLAAAVLLLLVACGNAAAFLLGAGIDREQELAVRGAIGAARRRIMAQLLIESTLLALLAVGFGVLAASGLSQLMLAMAPSAVPGLADAALDGTVLGFAALTAVLFGIGFGMIPALSLSNVDLAGAMGSGRTTSGRRARLQSIVVIGELAITGVLAVTGLLLARTVGALDGVHPGFDYDRLALAAVAVPYGRFQTEDGSTDQEAVAVYENQLRQELTALPGVTGVSVTSTPPFSNWRGNNDVMPEGWEEGRPLPMAERRFVSPDFFDVTGIEIVQGRGFTPEDAVRDAPFVVVISEGLAELGWPDASPVGRPLFYWGRQATVVGVARNIRDEEIEEVTELAFYAPGSSGPFLVRTEGDPSALIPSIRERIWSFDEDLPIVVASSLPDLVAGANAEERYRARLMGFFAGLAGLLALLGIYGVSARSVGRRTKEIGIRVALGAERSRVWRMVSAQAIRLGLAGAILGVLGSVATAGVIERFLFGVSADDPLSLAAVLVGLPLLATLAAIVPARRATRIDPREALRAE